MKNNAARKAALREAVLFVAITFILSAIVYLLMFSGSLPLPPAYQPVVLMYCPAIAALATRFYFHRNFRGLGWGIGNPKYLLLAFFLPIITGIIIYGLVWLAGFGAVNPAYAAEMFSLGFAPTVLFFLLFNMFAAFGEELGWRGLLVPKLAKLTDFTKLALISGIIWALWHFPLIIFGTYHGDTPLWYSLTTFTLSIIPAAFVFAWIRLKSGSVWSAVALHGSWNFFIQFVFDRLTLDTGMTKYLTGEFGLLSPIMYIILAIIFWKMRGRLPKQK